MTSNRGSVPFTREDAERLFGGGDPVYVGMRVVDRDAPNRGVALVKAVGDNGRLVLRYEHSDIEVANVKRESVWAVA